MVHKKTEQRCFWVPEGDLLYEKYHDEEWGVPVHDDKKLFEFLTLESAQAGLSWRIILGKREAYRKAFANFNPKKVSNFSKKDLRRLMGNEGIVRNEKKINSAILNARAFLETQKEFGTFAKYMWEFVSGRPIVNKIKDPKEMPTKTEISERIAKDMKKRGFSFLGPVILYSHMQACGLINDHQIDCFRYKELVN